MKTDGRRNRATRSEMSNREDRVVDLLSGADGLVTIKEVQEELGLPYPATASLVQRMVESRKIVIAGRDKRSYLLTVNNRTEIPERTHEEEGTTLTKVRKPQTHNLSSVDINTVLSQLHIGLGGELKVSGFHIIEGERPVIDLRSPNGDLLSVTVLSN